MVRGFTLSVRLGHRNGCMEECYKGLPKDILHILVPYSISAVIIVIMKILFSDNILGIKNILQGYLTGRIGTGGTLLLYIYSCF